MGSSKRKIILCPYNECKATINPSNSATNFKNPALSVKLAVEREIIRPRQKILEVGAGNLRNTLYILKNVPHVRIFSYDLQNTIDRFIQKYREYKKLGGKIVGDDYGKQKYDIVLCTYVLESICPERSRRLILKTIASVLKKKGILIASFRGYPGVCGSRYKRCPKGEGLITPLKTFIKPYSIREVKKLLYSCNFKIVCTLQNYKVEKPQNIHVMACSE